MKDIAGRYLLVNQQFLSTFNLTETAILGKTDYDLFAANYADYYRDHDRQVLADKSVLKFEEEAVISLDCEQATAYTAQYTLPLSAGLLLTLVYV